MSKKPKKNIKKNRANDMPENMLPQNILPVGECVGERQNVYIAQAVYKEIHRFTKNKTTNESGGMLVGSVIEEFGKTNVVISGFIEAKYCEATPTTLTFTHDTWEHVHSELERKHNGKKIVGWIHTHPNFGIFLSEYDKFIHKNFFNEDYQVAYVIDPIQNIEGFYSWHLDLLEKCKGFYVYEKTGKDIDIGVGSDDPEKYADEESLFDIRNVIIGLLSVAVVLMLFFNIAINGRLDKIERQLHEDNKTIENMQKAIANVDIKTNYLASIFDYFGINIDPQGKIFGTPNLPIAIVPGTDAPVTEESTAPVTEGNTDAPATEEGTAPVTGESADTEPEAEPVGEEVPAA